MFEIDLILIVLATATAVSIKSIIHRKKPKLLIDKYPELKSSVEEDPFEKRLSKTQKILSKMIKQIFKLKKIGKVEKEFANVCENSFKLLEKYNSKNSNQETLRTLKLVEAYLPSLMEQWISFSKKQRKIEKDNFINFIKETNESILYQIKEFEKEEQNKFNTTIRLANAIQVKKQEDKLDGLKITKKVENKKQSITSDDYIYIKKD
jgi:hypothetical protein